MFHFCTNKLVLALVLLLAASPSWAQPTCTVLNSNTNTTGASSYTTASITPAPNQLILVTTESRISTGVSGGPNQPTVTGDNLTFVMVVTGTTSGATPNRRLSVLRAMGTAPTTGSLTIAFGGQAQTHDSYAVIQCANVPTSGSNGSDAIVQSAIANDGGTLGTTATVTMTNAPKSPFNLTLGYGEATSGGLTATAGSGFTIIAQGDETVDGTHWVDETALNKQTASWSWSGNNSWIMSAVEIASAVPRLPLVGAGF